MGNLVVCCKEGASKDIDPSEFARNNGQLIRKNKKVIRSHYVSPKKSPSKMMIVHHETEEEDDDTQEETFDPPQSAQSDQKAEEKPDDSQPEEKVEQFSVHDSNDDSKILKDVQVLAEELSEDNPYDVKPMIDPDMENEMPIARKRTHRRNNHQIKDLNDSKVNKMKTFYGVTGYRKDHPMSPIFTVITCDE